MPGPRPPLRGKYLQQRLRRNTAASWRLTDIPALCFWEMVTHMECARSSSLFKSGGFSPFLVFGAQSSTRDRERAPGRSTTHRIRCQGTRNYKESVVFMCSCHLFTKFPNRAAEWSHHSCSECRELQHWEENQ